MSRAKKEAEKVVGATGQQEQDMHTLELEVQELHTAISNQQQQVRCNWMIHSPIQILSHFEQDCMDKFADV